MENTMKQLLSTRLFGFAIAAAVTAAAFVATAQARTASRSGTTGALVALRTTALGPVLVNGRGHTLYLFGKDRNGVSACKTACLTYWPALTSAGMPHAGVGVHQSLLRLGTPAHGARQVLYAGHPLYTFAGDRGVGQTTGENLSNFGGEWYAVAASGLKVEPSTPATASPNSTGGY
jgi:predicted lipoprotein with Yx(FWY)xxD motif